MAVNSTEEGQDPHSIAVLPDQGTAIPLCETKLSFVKFLEVPQPLKHSLSLDAALKSQIKINQDMEDVDIYFPCSMDVDIEKGNIGKPKTKNEPVGKVKTGSLLTKNMQREISIQMGEKITQMLMEPSLVFSKFNFRDKCIPERVYDSANNRLKKYKRSASFNSRKVVLLFSVFSVVISKLSDYDFSEETLIEDLQLNTLGRKKGICRTVKYGNIDSNIFDLTS